MKNTISMKFPMLIVSPEIWSVCFVRIVGKSLFFFLKTKCFSAAFHLLPSIFLSPMKWSTVICQKKCQIHLDRWSRNKRRSSHNTRRWLEAWENCLSKVRREGERGYFGVFKEKWLQNKAISLWNLIHMHSIIFPEKCCSNICIPANSYERYVGYMSYY